jgi:HPt (histidine-containing phosphotransfer) domain-containing protein
LAVGVLIFTQRESMPDLILPWDTLLRNLGHNSTLAIKVVQAFLTDCPSRLEAVVTAVDAGDAAELRVAAHSLRGAVALLGAPDAVAAALALEKMGQSGSLQNAGQSLQELKHEIEQVVRVLRENYPQSA